jgi:predicted nucleic acid-binding protein
MATEERFVDTGILVAATDTSRADHRASTALLTGGVALVTSVQVLREYLVVATRPRDVNGLGLPLAAALGNVGAFRTAVRLLPEDLAVLPTFLALLDAAPSAGKRIHDAWIVATALAHGVPAIVTSNTEDLEPWRDHVAVISPRDIDA